MIFKKTGSQDF